MCIRDSKEAGGMNMDTAADLSGEVGYVPLAYLAQFFGLSLTRNGAARTAALSTGSDLTVADIQSIQAYTDETMYGTGVVEVQVTYKPGVNVSGVTADSYILEDQMCIRDRSGVPKLHRLPGHRPAVSGLYP